MAGSVLTRVKFDGPALEGRSMDVAHLAPSLLALSDLIKSANSYANGERAAIRVLINADVEQKCFELDIELALTIWERAKSLVAEENIVAAKEIAEWLGIVVGGSLGLFGLIKLLKGKKVDPTTVVTVKNGNLVQIPIEGESHHVEVQTNVYNIYSDEEARRKVVKVLAPLREEGYESLDFSQGDDVSVSFKKEDVPAADGSDLPEVTIQNVRKSTIRAEVRIRRAAYEGASKWTLIYRRAYEMRIDDLEWLERFQNGMEFAPPGSWLDVDLEETYVTNESGEIIGEASYRVTKVHKVILPAEQVTMRLGGESSDSP